MSSCVQTHSQNELPHRHFSSHPTELKEQTFVRHASDVILKVNGCQEFLDILLDDWFVDGENGHPSPASKASSIVVVLNAAKVGELPNCIPLTHSFKGFHA